METTFQITQNWENKYVLEEIEGSTYHTRGTFDNLDDAVAKIRRIFKVDRRCQRQRERARSNI